VPEQGEHDATTAPSRQAPAWVGEVTFECETCSVCLQAMGEACPVSKLACGHGFHVGCIQKWLQKSSSCPLCKADAPSEPAPKTFKVDLGHQEMSQIMTELEDIFIAVHACAGPDHPIALNGLAYNLCVSLGYEDEDELEEAIGGSLADFLGALPHFKVHWPVPAEDEPAEVAEPAAPAAEVEAAEPATEKEEVAEAAETPAVARLEPTVRATMIPEPPRDEFDGPGSRVVFTVNGREDLWRVVLQGPFCNIEIPELEFVIRPKDKRRVDTIYNIIASAVFHLGDHVKKNTRARAISEEEVARITEIIEALNVSLDAETPFTVVLSDRQGISEFKPMDGVHCGPWVAGLAEEDEPQEARQNGAEHVPDALEPILETTQEPSAEELGESPEDVAKSSA